VSQPGGSTHQVVSELATKLAVRRLKPLNAILFLSGMHRKRKHSQADKDQHAGSGHHHQQFGNQTPAG
jgi:hypothetical protein